MSLNPKRTSRFPLRPAAALAFLLAGVSVLSPQMRAQAALSRHPVLQPDGAAPPPQTLEEALRRLHTTARLMHTTAHPDDEDGAMLVFEARGKGVSGLLMTLTRGEGGQNKVGGNLFDELGILRTLELLASSRAYGVAQRFSAVADFGFSKTADETFEQWHGHDPALADMVRVIRTFRPDVIVSRFQGTPRDGHGNHQAAGILSREAFRAAADPDRFPEQIREGLQPWQAKKFYMDHVRPDEDWTLRLDTGAVDPALGASPARIAIEGLKHQLSQGAGSWNLAPGPHWSYYKLVDSVLPGQSDPSHVKEQSFFDGIDTSLPGLATRLGADASKIVGLAPTLRAIESAVTEADAAAAHSPQTAAHSLLHGRALVRQLEEQVRASLLPALPKAELLEELSTKEHQFDDAAALAAGLMLTATVQGPDAGRVIPGQPARLEITMTNGGAEPLTARALQTETPAGEVWGVLHKGAPLAPAMPAGGTQHFAYELLPSPDTPPTHAYFHRTSPETQTIYDVDPSDAALRTLPLGVAPLHVRWNYELGGEAGAIETVVTAPLPAAAPPEAVESPAYVLPADSVLVDPDEQVVPTSRDAATPVHVDTRSLLAEAQQGTVRMSLPPGWTARPSRQSVTLPAKASGDATFDVTPASFREDRATIQATLDAGGRSYKDGFTLVSREDIGSFPYFQPAAQRWSIVQVNVPRNLRVGYIIGAGDAIPTVLRQIGMDVTLLSPEELATGDLGRYGTIVLGIRAYDTRPDVRAHNQRLLDYVSGGGTLLVQYNAGVDDFNGAHLTPYPAQLGRERVSVEQAPVQILDPASPILQRPNRISPADFDGWVQERGLYFMGAWDPRYEPLLASHDPGEQPLKGGLLVAHYARGVYIYTGYAFFRQVPNGVPGAIRLFVNLLDAGHETR